MTAKEKALELGNKMYSGDVFSKSKQGHLDELELAKGRAIIAVDEIIEAVEGKFDEYWIEVKTEIEKL